MSNYEVLSPAVHSDLRVITDCGELYGDNVQYVLSYSLEFRNIQSCYPIFFAKHPEQDEYSPVALLGFEKDENLFLEGDQWNASYVPMMVQRQPFLIGNQVSADKVEKPVVSINMNSPRISAEKGKKLFENNKQPSDYLTKIIHKLEALHHGSEHNKGFMSALISNNLLEPFTLEIPLVNESKNQLVGFHTINEQKLLELDGATLEEFNRQGYLQPIYMALASYSRVRVLIEKKNARLSSEWSSKLKD